MFYLWRNLTWVSRDIGVSSAFDQKKVQGLRVKVKPASEMSK